MEEILLILSVIFLVAEIVFAAQICYYFFKHKDLPDDKKWLFEGVYGCWGAVIVIWVISMILGL